jgi:periplasmic divalent cation tolerance protein
MLLVVTSVPGRGAGEKMAETLVAEKLAACVHILPPHLAIYEWEGKLCREEECNLLIKTADENYTALESRLAEIHPYDVPMIYALKADNVLPAYAAWVGDGLKL